MNDRIDELIELLEAEPEGLRAAEFLQVRDVLRGLAGKLVADAAIEETRVVVTTTDGCRYYFYGFLGSEESARAAKSAPR
ncbi:MAG TPA: hypothetical protein VIW73_04910 [Candidatus Cybelea sp.]